MRGQAFVEIVDSLSIVCVRRNVASGVKWTSPSRKGSAGKPRQGLPGEVLLMSLRNHRLNHKESVWMDWDLPRLITNLRLW